MNRVGRGALKFAVWYLAGEVHDTRSAETCCAALDLLLNKSWCTSWRTSARLFQWPVPKKVLRCMVAKALCHRTLSRSGGVGCPVVGGGWNGVFIAARERFLHIHSRGTRSPLFGFNGRFLPRHHSQRSGYDQPVAC
ncbi:hypothetical protein TRVL_04842 [Trypanosoma vivax]|nr:hypothetical protein TRVL_04842 [Trypanosoma vivax]